jgi:hypothetical protein
MWPVRRVRETNRTEESRRRMGREVARPETRVPADGEELQYQTCEQMQDSGVDSRRS